MRSKRALRLVQRVSVIARVLARDGGPGEILIFVTVAAAKRR